MSKFIFIPFIIYVFCASHLSGQDYVSIELLDNGPLIQQDKDPKIGLALSGGAAKGLAHIGVIKYMEELGIPIDFITGTSMGSIVGGLLSMGYDSDDMIAIAEQLNWDEILSNKTNLDRIAPLEKFYHDKFPILFTLEDKEIFLPRGIFSGQSLDMTLSRVFFPTIAINNFDDLVIPFRCIAVDISTGEVLTLDSGYLGQAIRASMAIPLMFSPVELDGRLLVDGGLIRNFPVEDNIKMGANFIIGVYVGSEKETKEDLKSSFDILVQSTQMMGIIDSEKQMEHCDILIKPDVKEYGSLDFADYASFIQKGYEAAQLHEEEFLALKARLENRVAPNYKEKIVTPSRMYVNNVKAPTIDKPLNDIIINRCGLAQKSYLALDDVDEGLYRIYGTKNFENLSYTFRQDENNETNLEINADPIRKTEVGATFNRFNSTNSSLIFYSIFRNKFGEPSRLSLLTRLSDNPGIKGDYFVRLGRQRRLFLRSYAKAERYKLPLFLDGDLRRLYKSINYDVGINIGYETDNALKLEGGLKYSMQDLDPLVLQSIDFLKFRQQQLSINAVLTYNSLDRPAYPTKGISAELRVNNNFLRSVDDEFTNNNAEETLSVGEDDQTFSMYGSVQKIFSLDENITYLSSGYAYFRLGSSLLENLSVGGTTQSRAYNVPFLGLGEGELILKNALIVRQELRTNPYKNVYLSVLANIALGRRGFGSVVKNTDFTEIIVGFGAKLGIDTPIGPVDIDFGLNSIESAKVIVGAGYRFIF